MKTLKEFIKYVEENIYKKEKKDYIVYNTVIDEYQAMSRSRKERIEREFWTSTTLWKVYPYSKKLWEEIKSKQYFKKKMMEKREKEMFEKIKAKRISLWEDKFAEYYFNKLKKI